MLSASGRISIAGLLLLSVAGGCGDGMTGPPLAPVTGIVTLDGGAVEGATVTFVPNGEGAVSLALTDPDGRFTLQTAAGKMGAVVGDHTITVSLSVTTAPAGGTTDDGLAPAMESEGAPAPAIPKTLFLVPVKYAAGSTSGLTAKVPSGGLSDHKLELVSK